MKNINRVLLITVCVFAASAANAQTYNSNSGGYTTGYGTVYGSFGVAMATQNIYNTMQMQMQKTMMRNAMIKKWGLAAVEKAEREAGSSSGRSSSRSSNTSTGPVMPPKPVARNFGVFRPLAADNTAKLLGDALAETAEEKELIKKIYEGTKAAYEKQSAAKGWKNNLAGGLTFFAVTAMTVYHDAEEPSDEAVKTFYSVLNQTLDEIPEFGTAANKDKQGLNNVFIAFSGILLAGYVDAKQNNSPESLKTYRQLAGVLIQMVLKIEPSRLRLKEGNIVIVN